MSSMCTSSMKMTPGTISALPSSRHSATLASICSRTWGVEGARCACAVCVLCVLCALCVLAQARAQRRQQGHAARGEARRAARAHLWPDLARVAAEERQEALRAAVDDVDLVERDHVHHLLALLELALGALHKLGGGAHRVVVAAAREGAAELGHLACGRGGWCECVCLTGGHAWRQRTNSRRPAARAAAQAQAQARAHRRRPPPPEAAHRWPCRSR